MTSLKQFREKASEAEQDMLAEQVGTTKSYLFSHLGVHRRATLEKAVAIEKATASISTLNGGETPIIYRDMVCDTCATCPLACASRAKRGE